MFRYGKDIHSYTHPNNPDNNEWHNLALEDIGLYWDLVNFDEQKYFYFQAVNFTDQSNEFQKNSPVDAMSRDELIDDEYGWKLSERTHKWATHGFGAVSAGCAALFYWAF